MMAWRDRLKVEARVTVRMLADQRMWRDMGLGLLALAQLLIRILVILTFPISTPLFALNTMLQERRRAEEDAKIRASLRADIHRNGRGD